MDKQRVDELGKKYRELSTSLKKVGEEISTIEAELVECTPKKDSGVVHLDGNEFGFDITYRQNVSYLDKNALNDVIGSLPEGDAEKMFRFEAKEKTKEVEKYIEAGGTFAPRLAEIRTVKSGKPSIKLKLM